MESVTLPARELVLVGRAGAAAARTGFARSTSASGRSPWCTWASPPWAMRRGSALHERCVSGGRVSAGPAGACGRPV